MGRTIYLELVGSSKIANDLAAGGLFVQDKTLAVTELCELVLFNDGGQLELAAKAVYCDGNGGVGLELIGFDSSLKARIDELIAAGAAAAAVEAEAATAGAAGTGAGAGADAVAAAGEADDAREDAIDGGGRPSDERRDGVLDLGLPEVTSAEAASAEAAASELPSDITVSEDEDPQFKSLHERLRGLPLIEQIKRARDGDITERILLERMYGKNVWEALLRNARLTAQEVARIARMGAIPRPLLEIIFANGGWLQVPEVRRALLTNPRLGNDQILKLLRMMPKHELKLAAVQTAYSFAVRSAAKTMLKEDKGY